MTVTENVSIRGNLDVSGTVTGQTRSGLTADTSQEYGIGVVEWRIWDAFQTNLTTAGTDDLGITTGTWATGTPYITAGDLKAAGATTRRARAMFTLPPEYVAGDSMLIRASAGMVTTIADVSATIDFEIYKSDEDITIGGSDLVTTAATTINSVTFGDKDFTITSTGLSPGDQLDIRMSIAVNDAATVTAVIGAVAAIKLVMTIKG